MAHTASSSSAAGAWVGGPVPPRPAARARRARDRAVRARARPGRVPGPLPDHPAGPARTAVRRAGRPAYEAWEQVEAESGQQMVTRTGGPGDRGPPGAGGTSPTGQRNIEGYTAMFDRFGVDYELLDADEWCALAPVPPRRRRAGPLPGRIGHRRRRAGQRRARRPGPRARRRGPWRTPRCGRCGPTGTASRSRPTRHVPGRPGGGGQRRVDEPGAGRTGLQLPLTVTPGAGHLLRHPASAGVRAVAVPGVHVARRAQLLRLPRLRGGRHQARPAHGRPGDHGGHPQLRPRPGPPRALRRVRRRGTCRGSAGPSCTPRPASTRCPRTRTSCSTRCPSTRRSPSPTAPATPTSSPR